MTTAEKIACFLERFDSQIARQARGARKILRRIMPAAVELVYDNYNALVFAFAPDEHASHVVVSIALYPRWVTLFFLHGKRLDDPHGLLEGAGSLVRSIRLESVRDLDKRPVRELIDQAIARADVPLPAEGRGRTVIRAVAPKQRDRRPRGAITKRAAGKKGPRPSRSGP